MRQKDYRACRESPKLDKVRLPDVSLSCVSVTVSIDTHTTLLTRAGFKQCKLGIIVAYILWPPLPSSWVYHLIEIDSADFLFKIRISLHSSSLSPLATFPFLLNFFVMGGGGRWIFKFFQIKNNSSFVFSTTDGPIFGPSFYPPQ